MQQWWKVKGKEQLETVDEFVKKNKNVCFSDYLLLIALYVFAGDITYFIFSFLEKFELSNFILEIIRGFVFVVIFGFGKGIFLSERGKIEKLQAIFCDFLILSTIRVNIPIGYMVHCNKILAMNNDYQSVELIIGVIGLFLYDYWKIYRKDFDYWKRKGEE